MAGSCIRRLDVYKVLGCALTAALTLMTLSCGGTAGPGTPPAPPPGNTDTTPPSVAVTAPTGGATVAGQQTLLASASDNVGVVGVQFRLDGSNWGVEDTTAPYSVTWDSTAVGNGQHTLTAVARDAAGNSTTSGAVQVTVNNGPAVQITTTSLPSAALSFSYSTSMSAAGGSGSYSWSLFSGQLPNGIALSSATGTLSGVPTVAGLFTFIIEARDSAGTVASATFSLGVSSPTSVYLPAARGCYTDPETGNRVCTVTDPALCSNGGFHNYSYIPVWNQSGTHLIAECQGWAVTGGRAILLIRDSDLSVVGDALQGSTASLSAGKLFWSWTDPNKFYGYGTGSQSGRIFERNPFTRVETLIKNFAGMTFFGRTVTGDARLAYVSFDDRYFLVELFTNGPLVLAVYDCQTDTVVGALDTGQFNFYDEAVFTKDNFVWVRATDALGPQSFRYPRNFSVRTRSVEDHHHAHGLRPDGTPIGVLETANRSCPPGSLSGIPASPWKPTAVIVNQLIDTTGASTNQGPLASIMHRIACDVPGQHEFSHFSWNSFHTDRFFTESWSYSGAATDPIHDAILRHRLLFTGTTLTGSAIDILARHRTEKRFGYYATPRVSCNQQASRCLFASSMTVGTTNTNSTPHLYIVDVP